jgi:hypothetical protein
MILPAKMSGAEKRERMAIMEAAISSAMNHPNIVQVRCSIHVMTLTMMHCQALPSRRNAATQQPLIFFLMQSRHWSVIHPEWPNTRPLTLQTMPHLLPTSLLCSAAAAAA